ncbi:tRNA endonuclease ANKZF1-like isoform X2 [Physella acuta]|uniref:tRNA endonuclease ANKZF1-like isoform X2 n=1 Tax=Physella acuta TaxID=109671 RepID=UPI0027DD31BF|nr:tRNA endonuclease ANKZF1-like isoform X2 [Physella acuta]
MRGPRSPQRQALDGYSCHLLFDAEGSKKLQEISIPDGNPSVSLNLERAERETRTEDVAADLQLKLVTSDTLFCNCCQTKFANREDQLEHYKCDWHRYNLHLRLRNMTSISEEEFEKISGDVSSISGSDEDDDDDEDNEREQVPVATNDFEEETPKEHKYHKVFFKNKDDELLSVYRCLLHHKKNPLENHEDLVTAINQLPKKFKWIVLMVSSGHFAGAVFYGNEVIEHKTFHRYTIRAKRGTAQSSKDSQGNAPKSAGASLRRYNESALVLEVQELMSSWSEHIRQCDLVLMRVPVANRAMFFGGKDPGLKKDDHRIRVIPVTTRRPTFKEIKRVHQLLATVECYGKNAEIADLIPKAFQTKKHAEQSHEKVSQDNKEKQKKIPQDSFVNDHENMCDTKLDEETDHKPREAEIKKKSKKKSKNVLVTTETSEESKETDEETTRVRNLLFTACKTGDSQLLEKTLTEFDNSTTQPPADVSQTEVNLCHQTEEKQVQETASNNSVETTDQNKPTLGEPNSVETDSSMATGDSTNLRQYSAAVVSLLNMPVYESGTTFLHIASKEGHHDTVRILLEAGSDPSIKDKGGKTPYNFGDSEVRNTYRRFMAMYPDRYDYTKAQVPSPLTAEMEAEKKQKAAEKRKAKKKALNEKNKEKKAAEAVMRQENQEKERFLSLSDREKRALAAERRLLQQSINQGCVKPVLSRCWQCGTDITGKVPFEYSDYKFCTTKCLREHRSKPSS